MATTYDLMNLIGRMEGWGIPNSVATRNNNPGNLKYVGQTGATGADGNGYAIFNNSNDGMIALQRQIELDASRDLSIRQFINKYAPPSENNTSGYLSFVTSGLGVSPDSPLSGITKGIDFVPGFDDTEGINLGSYEMSYNSSFLSGDIPIWGIVLAGLAVGVVIWKLE